jgi:hypothetical protein
MNLPKAIRRKGRNECPRSDAGASAAQVAHLAASAHGA